MPLPVEHFRILVVDPDSFAADELAEALRSYGFRVRAVGFSDAALVIAESFRPHALIAEVVMPGMNGIELSNQFARRFPNCKVLLMSEADSDIETMEQSLPSSEIAFLRKPLPIYELLEFLAASLPASDALNGYSFHAKTDQSQQDDDSGQMDQRERHSTAAERPRRYGS